jgi:hypothetical protein
MLEGGGIGPLSERRLDEALGLAVGLRAVGLDLDVLDAELLAGVGEGFREIQLPLSVMTRSTVTPRLLK